MVHTALLLLELFVAQHYLPNSTLNYIEAGQSESTEVHPRLA
jgi:hypothetical protein